MELFCDFSGCENSSTTNKDLIEHNNTEGIIKHFFLLECYQLDLRRPSGHKKAIGTLEYHIA